MTTHETATSKTPYDADIARLEAKWRAFPREIYSSEDAAAMHVLSLKRDGYLTALAAHGASFCGSVECACYKAGVKAATPPDISDAERAAYGRGQ